MDAYTNTLGNLRTFIKALLLDTQKYRRGILKCLKKEKFDQVGVSGWKQK